MFASHIMSEVKTAPGVGACGCCLLQGATRRTRLHQSGAGVHLRACLIHRRALSQSRLPLDIHTAISYTRVKWSFSHSTIKDLMGKEKYQCRIFVQRRDKSKEKVITSP